MLVKYYNVARSNLKNICLTNGWQNKNTIELRCKRFEHVFSSSWRIVKSRPCSGQVQFAEWQAPSALACRALAAVEDFLMQLHKRLEEGAPHGEVTWVFTLVKAGLESLPVFKQGKCLYQVQLSQPFCGRFDSTPISSLYWLGRDRDYRLIVGAFGFPMTTYTPLETTSAPVPHCLMMPQLLDKMRGFDSQEVSFYDIPLAAVWNPCKITIITAGQIALSD